MSDHQPFLPVTISEIPYTVQTKEELIGAKIEVDLALSGGQRKSGQAGIGLVTQAANAALPGPNDRKDLAKAVRVFNAQTPEFNPGDSRLDTLNTELLCLSTVATVEHGPQGFYQQYRLLYDPTGPLQVYQDGRFTGPKFGARWEHVPGGGGGSSAVLYPSLGQNTNGSLTQKAATDNLALKVDKVTGKGLSTQDFTTTLLNKLTGLVGLTALQKQALDASNAPSTSNPFATLADIPVGGGGGGTALLYPGTGPAVDGAITQKGTTDALTLKVDKVTGKQLTSNDYSNTEKNKVAELVADMTQAENDVLAVANRVDVLETLPALVFNETQFALSAPNAQNEREVSYIGTSSGTGSGFAPIAANTYGTHPAFNTVNEFAAYVLPKLQYS